MGRERMCITAACVGVLQKASFLVMIRYGKMLRKK